MVPWIGLCLLLASGFTTTETCTLIVVGKHATADGSVLLAHTDDAGGDTTDIRLARVPPMNHPKDARRPVYSFDSGYPRLVANERGPHYEPKDGQELTPPIGHIPQVRRTYGYYDHDYGLINEAGLALAETTVSSRTYGFSRRLPYGHNLFDIGELSKVAMERCATARCAIQTMGDLAVEYGFYTNYTGTPEKPALEDSAEVLGVADRSGEAWIFHVVTGDNHSSAVWVAQRVPDGHIAVVPNTLVIRTIDFHDRANFMFSDNVKSVAERNGWWKPQDGPFDFARTYVVSDPIPIIPLYVGRRMWRIYSLTVPSVDLDPTMGYLARSDRATYPFSIPVDKKITARALMAILGDHYEGTPYDQTVGMAAGPFGNPNRFGGVYGWNSTTPFPGSWERTVSVARAIYSFVTSVRPNTPPALAAVMWYGLDAPHGSVWVPFYGGQGNVPVSYRVGMQSEFSRQSAYWAFNLVNNWKYQMWRLIHAEVALEQARLQDMAAAFHKRMERAARRIAPEGKQLEAFLRHAEEKQEEFAALVVEEWWNLAFRLIAKYNNGYVCTGERHGQQRSWGYPMWWLEQVGYTKWPGDTFKPLEGEPATPAPALPPPVSNDGSGGPPTSAPPTSAPPTPVPAAPVPPAADSLVLRLLWVSLGAGVTALLMWGRGCVAGKPGGYKELP